MTPATCGRLIGLALLSPLLVWFALSLLGLPLVFWPGAVAVLGVLGAGFRYGILPLLRSLRDFAQRFWHRRVAALSTGGVSEASNFAGLEQLVRIAGEQAAGYAAESAASDTPPLDRAA